MNERAGIASSSSPDIYSPKHRTALVLTGTGTAGAYHAGVLRALHEAGVKLDVVAGRGIGAVGALFAAIDGGQRLWGEKGFWAAPAVRSLYGWRTAPRVLAWGVAAAVTVVAVPLAVFVVGLLVFPIDFVVKMIGVGGSGGLVGAYLRLALEAFAPGALPTWVPRIVVLILAACGGFAFVTGLLAGRGRRIEGSLWWRAAGPPMSAGEAAAHCWRVLWEAIGGGSQVKQPPSPDLARRYTDLLAENIGQPGFRELLIAVHDLDAHRDVVFALVAESRRRGIVRRPTTDATERRRAEAIDLAGAGGEQLAAGVAAALTVPVATETANLTFVPDSYWRGETHRLCDRPGCLARILDELVDLEVAQIVLVSAAPESAGPHELHAPRIDGRGRIGEYLISAEAASVRDATCAADVMTPRIFTIRPSHNPLGPFDFTGAYDGRSERRQPLGELMARGYEDAYRQFIEPVVGGEVT
jgi:hypothetical protein